MAQVRVLAAALHAGADGERRGFVGPPGDETRGGRGLTENGGFISTTEGTSPGR